FFQAEDGIRDRNVTGVQTCALQIFRMLIKEMGYNPDRYNLADGCGLSNYNYISPELLVSFLRYAYSRTDVFQKLYKALPIGGVRSEERRVGKEFGDGWELET